MYSLRYFPLFLKSIFIHPKLECLLAAFGDDSPSGICWYQVTEKADVQYGCGYEVIILHADSLSTQYCHLASISVQAGNTIVGGQDIGYQGSTGWATGKHLHFALWRGGQPIDPS